MPSQNNDRPNIEYPCEWGFKIIGTDEQALRRAVKKCLQTSLKASTGSREYELGFSRASGKGNYVSLTLNLEVCDETERDALFKNLGDLPEVRLVI